MTIEQMKWGMCRSARRGSSTRAGTTWSARTRMRTRRTPGSPAPRVRFREPALTAMHAHPAFGSSNLGAASCWTASSDAACTQGHSGQVAKAPHMHGAANMTCAQRCSACRSSGERGGAAAHRGAEAARGRGRGRARDDGGRRWAALKRRIAALLERGETVTEALKRLRAAAPPRGARKGAPDS